MIGMHDIIITKISPKNSGVLIDGITTTVTVKWNNKRQISWYIIENCEWFNVRKYVNWEKNDESWKMFCQSSKGIYCNGS